MDLENKVPEEEKDKNKKWFCGHYHTNKSIDKLRILFEDILVFSK